jgi:NAD(P)-dependent dehydrogenase (short-subunit alcohol dehydrogenase family)
VDLGLGGKRIIVFGAASGIGATIARAFVIEGAQLIAIDRNPSVLDVTAFGATASRESPAIAFVSDVTDWSVISKLAADCSSRFGPTDHIVFAVGAGSGKFGFPFWKLQRELPATPADRSLLMLSSVAGQIGSQTDPPYSAAKAALINFAQCAAKDLAAFGIRVNSLCPGMVQTPLNQAVYESWAREQPVGDQLSYEVWAAEKIKRVVPLNRWQQTEDIAAMSLFLASANARNITGQTINVDGGFVMHW